MARERSGAGEVRRQESEVKLRGWRAFEVRVVAPNWSLICAWTSTLPATGRVVHSVERLEAGASGRGEPSES